LALAALGAAAAIAYAPSFGVPLQFDDEARLTHNLSMQRGGLLDAVRWLGNSRVIPSLTLVLNYRLGEFDPLGYHIGNFAVHLLTTIGVFALALTLCRTPRLSAAWPRHRALLLATAAGLVFACHPLQTQAVTYIIQRYASMAALFYVWSVVCYLRARLRQRGVEGGHAAPYVAASAALGIAAVLSKENAVSLPAALLLSEWVGFGWPRRGRVLAIGAGATLVILAVPLVWKTVTWQPLAKSTAVGDVSLSTRMLEALLGPRASPLLDARPAPLDYLLTQATVVPRYLGLFMLPWGLNVDHDVAVVQGLTLPVLAGVALLAGLAAFGLSQVTRRPLPAFALLWFFVTLSVESSLIPIDDMMMEHRMYLPMAGLAVGAGWLFAGALDRAPRVALPIGVAVIAALVALTFARNVVWRSPVTLWLDAAEKSPHKVRPHVNLGAAYHKIEQLDAAIAQYCRALDLNPGDVLARDNLELALSMQGRLDAEEPKVVEVKPDGTQIVEVEDVTAYCPDDSATTTDEHR
jgi:hypothetical protein